MSLDLSTIAQVVRCGLIGILVGCSEPVYVYKTPQELDSSYEEPIVSLNPTDSGNELHERLTQCGLYAPAHEQRILFGTPTRFHGRAVDSDSLSSTLSVSWESDLDGVFMSGPTLPSGVTEFEHDGLSPGVHSITMRATDNDGATCEKRVSVRVGHAPTLLIEHPTEGRVVNRGETLPFNAAIVDDTTDLSEVIFQVESDRDGLVSSGQATEFGTFTAELAGLSVGQHTLTLYATDIDGFTGKTSTNIMVNRPQTAR